MSTKCEVTEIFNRASVDLETNNQVYTANYRDADICHSVYYIDYTVNDVGEERDTRLINNYLCSSIAGLINQAMGAPLDIPAYRIAVSDGELQGLVSTTVSFESIFEFSEDEKGCARLLSDPGYGVHDAIRLFLEDPDGVNNLGYTQHQNRLSAIDFELGNYSFLANGNYLNDGESDRLPHGNWSPLQLTDENIHINFFQDPNLLVDDGSFYQCTGHDNFYDFLNWLEKFASSESDVSLVETYMGAYYQTLFQIAKLIHSTKVASLIDDLKTDFPAQVNIIDNLLYPIYERSIQLTRVLQACNVSGANEKENFNTQYPHFSAVRDRIFNDTKTRFFTMSSQPDSQQPYQGQDRVCSTLAT